MPHARITFPQPHKGRQVGDVVEVSQEELANLKRDGKGFETTAAAKSRRKKSDPVETDVPTSASPPSSE